MSGTSLSLSQVDSCVPAPTGRDPFARHLGRAPLAFSTGGILRTVWSAARQGELRSQTSSPQRLLVVPRHGNRSDVDESVAGPLTCRDRADVHPPLSRVGPQSELRGPDASQSLPLLLEAIWVATKAERDRCECRGRRARWRKRGSAVRVNRPMGAGTKPAPCTRGSVTAKEAPSTSTPSFPPLAASSRGVPSPRARPRPQPTSRMPASKKRLSPKCASLPAGPTHRAPLPSQRRQVGSHSPAERRQRRQPLDLSQCSRGSLPRGHVESSSRATPRCRSHCGVKGTAHLPPGSRSIPGAVRVVP